MSYHCREKMDEGPKDSGVRVCCLEKRDTKDVGQ